MKLTAVPYVTWLVPLVLVIVVVVTTLAVNRLVTPQPDRVLVKFTYGATVVATQVVPIR